MKLLDGELRTLLLRQSELVRLPSIALAILLAQQVCVERSNHDPHAQQAKIDTVSDEVARSIAEASSVDVGSDQLIESTKVSNYRCM